MTIGPLSRPSVPDQVFQRLCDLIITGEYPPGERLPTQRALAGQFGVNMASVREAVKRLEQLRLVEVRHGDATRVLDWRRSGLEALALLGAVDANVVRPLFESRRLILTQVASLAAERRTDAQADHLDDVAARLQTAASDEDAQVLDWEFVAEIVDAAHNLIFELIAIPVRELYMTHGPRFLPLVHGREELGPLYLRVAEAIRSCDAAAAASAMAALTGAQEARMVHSL